MEREKGFTLIELMIVLIVFGILSSIAFPMYSNYKERGYRTEGRSAVLDLVARQDRFYMQNTSYVIKNSDVEKKLGLKGLNSSTGKYVLSISARTQNNTNGYIITATNTFGDTSCATFFMDSTGKKGFTGTGDTNICW